MDELKNKALNKHYEWKGKIKTAINFSIDNKEELAIGYTPGVAYPCLEIQKDYSKSFEENLSCIKYELLYKIFKGGN